MDGDTDLGVRAEEAGAGGGEVAEEAEIGDLKFELLTRHVATVGHGWGGEPTFRGQWKILSLLNRGVVKCR